jgi:membrane-associated phospholipid phosphatase
MDIIKSFFKSITLLGNIAFYIIILLFAYLTNNSFLKLLIALIIALTLAVLIRIVYFKPRPNKAKTNTLWLRLYNSSFPSVHAIRAVILAYFFIQTYPHAIIIISSITLALLVCYSRIYLKKHDWVDISAGILIGVLLSLLLL